MTTLVTGAGLIGSLAAERLARGGERVVLFDVAFSAENVAEHVGDYNVPLVRGDVTELSELIAAIDEHGVERIIHTASLLTSTVAARPVAGVRTNLIGTLAVLEAARLTGVSRVVSCSTGSVVMGTNWDFPNASVTEDHAVHLVSEYPPSIYGTMKLACEWLSHNYEDSFGVRSVSMRLGGVFGPWRGSPNGGPSRLVQQIIDNAWHGRPVRLTTSDLDQRMDFIYASDVAKGLVLGAEHANPASRVYNLAGDHLYSVREAVVILEQVLGRAIELEAVENGERRVSYAPSPRMDTSSIASELGFVRDFDLAGAFENYIGWLKRADDSAGGR